MFYDAIQNKHGLKHDPFKALMAPRPIGWISTVTVVGELVRCPSLTEQEKLSVPK